MTKATAAITAVIVPDQSVADYDRAHDNAATDLIETLTNSPHWGVAFHIDSRSRPPTVTRVTDITFPQINNGHQGRTGSTYEYQLDVADRGKGSKDRLIVTISLRTITGQSYHQASDVITAHVTLTGEAKVVTAH
ncbi:MAG: hypothetical protein JF625_21130 [Inquilinus limosus]|uniref:Uncharacterized protein n=1 Tax=Inquilinus limosus TaxID=171674 RepID=A0A952KGN9_9PROT|nr:hypothetical protein [Inquilinus limosus]